MGARHSKFFAVLVASIVLHASAGSMGPAFSPAAKVQALEEFRALIDDALDNVLALTRPEDFELDLALKRANAHRSGTLIGISRASAISATKSSDPPSVRWRATASGAVATWRVSSSESRGVRVGLRLDARLAGAEIRVAGIDASGRAGEVTFIGSQILALLPVADGAIEFWTPSTWGLAQRIEVWLPAIPELERGVEIFDVSHLFVLPNETSQPMQKLLSCQVELACIADATYQTQGKAVARMNYVKNGSSYLCSGALLNDRTSSFAPLFATANHCISTSTVAATLETWWFHQPGACGGAAPTPTRRSGGAAILVTDFDSDFTFLRLNENAPGGAYYLGWNPAAFAANEVVWGIHHPSGSLKKFSYGSFTRQSGLTNNATGVQYGKLFNLVNFVQGIVEGGSSGSPLINGTGHFRGTLYGTPSTSSCADRRAYYSDFAQTYPLISHYLEGTATSDDYGNSPSTATAINANTQFVARLGTSTDQDWFRVTLDSPGNWTLRTYTSGTTPVDTVGRLYAADGVTVLAENDDGTDVNFILTVRANPGTYYVRVIGYNGATGPYGFQSVFVTDVDDHGNSAAAATAMSPSGATGGTLESGTDQDWFRVSFPSAGTWSVASTGSTDVIGTLYNASGAFVAENDDAAPPDRNFGLALTVAAGSTYFLRVTGYDGSRGEYGLASTFSVSTSGGSNYTDLWWNPAESGWGINLNQQGNVMFAALFTYDTAGRDWWLVASNMSRQPDGSFTGTLYNTEGPAFAANPWGAFSAFEIGAITVRFNETGTSGTLTYNVGAVIVTKTIQRQRFGPGPACTFTAGGREGATNYQDLWWNASEPGWGINVTHQGTTIFATLFTYDTDRLNMWLVASGLQRQFDGSYSGALYRTRGPGYNAQPWGAVSPTQVGTMTMRFSNGSAGTLSYSVNGITVTKSFVRQVFSSPTSLCN